MHLLKKIPVFISSILAASLWISCGNAQTHSADKHGSFCQEIKGAWNILNVSFQKRSDIAKNFANSFKDSGKISDSLLIALADSRMTAMDFNATDPEKMTANDIAAYKEAQRKVIGSLMPVLLEVEKHPGLKESKMFADLQGQLQSVELDIAAAKKKYNTSVGDCKTLDETRKKELIFPAK